MSRRIVDLSVELRAGIASDPPAHLPEIKYHDHKTGAKEACELFKGLTRDDLPGGEAWAHETLSITTHAGTHVDAPYHYRSEMDDGQPTMTIDDIPLEWFIGPGVKLDFRAMPDGYLVMPDDIDKELTRIGHKLAPGDIVLVNTAAGIRYGKSDYVDVGCGMGRAATLHLTSQGVRVVGTDAWMWDTPMKYTIRRFQANHDPSIVWEGHFAGSTIPYCQIEKLGNLEQIPAHGFTVICFPVKVYKASAGWTRVVAVFD